MGGADGMANSVDHDQTDHCLYCLLYLSHYSKPSVARTLMACLPCCFELVLESLGKNPIGVDLG